MAKLTRNQRHAVYMKKWRKRNPVKTKQYRQTGYTRNKTTLVSKRLKLKYGISLEQYDALLAAQNNSCAICGSDKANSTGARFHVDHCHTTGKVRGLLCYKCNSVLGYANDDQRILAKAMLYLSGDTRNG